LKVIKAIIIIISLVGEVGMWERVLHMWLHRRDQPFELAAFAPKGSVTPVYSRQVFLNHRLAQLFPTTLSPFDPTSYGL